MLLDLHCQNFRKHADLTVHFTPGINAIRAPNEQGKSTMLEAIAYAYFGAKGIKAGETIADVVTYDMPVNSLKVDHSFTIAGVTYRIVRSPKGAELTAPGITVTGQTEVTKFVERLFGTSQDMAAKLMLAKQKNLGGALAGGPTEAGKMIEDLADIGLIEELIGQIGEHLPAGNTAATEGMIGALREQAEPGELPDLEPLRQECVEAQNTRDGAAKAHHDKKAELDELDLDAARAILSDEKVLRAAILDKGQRIAALEVQLAAKVSPAPDLAEIEALRAKIEEQKHLAEANRLHAQLKGAKIEVLWDEPTADLEAEIEKADGQVQSLEASYLEIESKLRSIETQRVKGENAYQVAKTRLEGQLIKETTCALCQKDLSDVPEVARFNSPLQTELDHLSAEHAKASTASGAVVTELNGKLPQLRIDLAAAREHLSDLNAVVVRSRQVDTLYAAAQRFITRDDSTVPATWTWTGPAGEPFDYAPKLRELEAARDAAQRAAAAREQAEQTLADLRVTLHGDEASLMGLQLNDARETLELEAALKPQAQALQEAAQAAERTLAAAAQAFELAQARREQLLEAAEKAKASLAAAEATLAEMQANNALIKKLRDARPKITDQLWAIVLAAVTTYFSDVRGERSVITRADGKFKVNGKPVTGLSGSAEDVLGLAIRFALTKTFLPNIRFVILDEVAAACDDQRELAMLGLLATSGFAQTILVTHSQHADAFADNIITL